MIKNPDQFAAAGQAALDACLKSAATAFESAERLAALNLSTARAALEDGSAAVRTLSAAKNPNELMELQSSLAQPAAQKALAYYRSSYEIIAQGLEASFKPYESQFAAANKFFASALEQAAQSVPGGGDAAVAAVRSAVAAANTAFENVNKATRQVVEITEANVAASTDAAVKAAEPNTAGSRKKTA